MKRYAPSWLPPVVSRGPRQKRRATRPSEEAMRFALRLCHGAGLTILLAGLFAASAVDARERATRRPIPARDVRIPPASQQFPPMSVRQLPEVPSAYNRCGACGTGGGG